MDEREHVLFVHVIGTVHLAPGAHEDALEDIDAVGMPVDDFRCLGHMLQDQGEAFRLLFQGVSVPVIEEADYQLSSCGVPGGQDIRQLPESCLADRGIREILQIELQHDQAGAVFLF